jgi:hypothetical protein
VHDIVFKIADEVREKYLKEKENCFILQDWQDAKDIHLTGLLHYIKK